MTSGPHSPISSPIRHDAKPCAKLGGALLRRGLYQVVPGDPPSLRVPHEHGEIVLHHEHEASGHVVSLQRRAKNEASEDERIDGVEAALAWQHEIADDQVWTG